MAHGGFDVEAPKNQVRDVHDDVVGLDLERYLPFWKRGFIGWK